MALKYFQTRNDVNFSLRKPLYLLTVYDFVFKLSTLQSVVVTQYSWQIGFRTNLPQVKFYIATQVLYVKLCGICM